MARTVAGATAGGSPSIRNPSIQCLRGVAALFVVLFHASGLCQHLFGDGSWAAVFDSRFGIAGVAIFFAISGLLMADLIQRTDPWRFLAHRIVRIYPTYLLAVSIAAPVIPLVGIGKLGFHGFSLLLVPVGIRHYYLRSVEWTLVFECTYYVALFLIAVAGWRRYLNWIALTWLAAILAATLCIGWSGGAWSSDPFYHIYSIWLAPANVAFAGGLLIPWIASRIYIPVGAGILAFCVLMAVPPGDLMVARWAAGAAAALLVLDVMRIKALPRAMLGLHSLGDWSYALYLAHEPCILVVYHLWPAGAATSAAPLLAVAVSIIVAAGFGTIDVWAYRQLKNAVDALSEESRRRRVNVYVGVFVIASLLGIVMT